MFSAGSNIFVFFIAQSNSPLQPAVEVDVGQELVHAAVVDIVAVAALVDTKLVVAAVVNNLVVAGHRVVVVVAAGTEDNQPCGKEQRNVLGAASHLVPVHYRPSSKQLPDPHSVKREVAARGNIVLALLAAAAVRLQEKMGCNLRVEVYDRRQMTRLVNQHVDAGVAEWVGNWVVVVAHWGMVVESMFVVEARCREIEGVHRGQQGHWCCSSFLHRCRCMQAEEHALGKCLGTY